MTEKRQRSAAKGRFTRILSIFNKEIDAEENMDIAELELVFHDVQNAWGNVESKHDAYVATLTDESPDEEDWIVTIQQKYKEARKRFTNVKKAFTEREAVKVHLRTREREYNNFIQICDNVKTLITKDPSKELLCKERENINQSYKKVNDAHNVYSRLAPDDDKKSLSWINRISEISLN